MLPPPHLRAYLCTNRLLHSSFVRILPVAQHDSQLCQGSLLQHHGLRHAISSLLRQLEASLTCQKQAWGERATGRSAGLQILPVFLVLTTWMLYIPQQQGMFNTSTSTVIRQQVEGGCGRKQSARNKSTFVLDQIVAQISTQTVMATLQVHTSEILH